MADITMALSIFFLYIHSMSLAHTRTLHCYKFWFGWIRSAALKGGIQQ